jgi:uncharacterized protein YlzI (FlbEa/FlbD family)
MFIVLTRTNGKPELVVVDHILRATAEEDNLTYITTKGLGLIVLETPAEIMAKIKEAQE